MPKVTIDGQTIEVAPKTTILRAAKQLGIDVPVFCYHPGLSIAANCRMCLVEIDKWGKPQPACYTEVGDGMVVHTNSARVEETQRAVLEFILLNHPVDCPICDQAGECVLQEHFVTWSAKPSRLSHEKIGKPKAKPLGPTVMLDAERCVVCTRCVRFCEEVTKTCELTVEARGEHSEITTPPGVELANDYSLNVVDLCPVGALTSRQFRFQRRVWFLDQLPSVCTGCAKGCAIRVDSHKGQVERVVPRYNPDVNGHWMCDAGRGLCDAPRDRAIVLGCVPGPNGESRQAPAAEGVRAIAAWLQAAKGGDGQVAIALSASLANEDVFAWARLGQLLGAAMFVLPRAPWAGDALLKSADRDCNAAGTTAILTALGVQAGGADALAAQAASFAAVVVVDNGARVPAALAEALAAVDRLAVLSAEQGELTDIASVVVPLSPLHRRDGTLTNADGWVQRLGQPLRPAVTTVAAHVAAAQIAQACLDVALEFSDKTKPADLFARIAAAVPAFAHLDYRLVGDLGCALTHGGQPRPARPRVDGSEAWEPDPVAPSYPRPFQLRRGA